ncbi:MAG: FAD-dependent oxidoreductase [Methylobacteriaceae bacterium]|nr:FAD-dependent oxidoreductase [Methylobacteriaceae bacterium]
MAERPSARVVGAGIAGLTAAYELARRGAAVELVERREAPGLGCSFYAGGMLAPWCEGESAEPLIGRLGQESLTYWTQIVPVARREGSLVVAPARDKPELARFARRTSAHEMIESDSIAVLEPDLAGRFDRALFFAQEAHLDPRFAVAELTRRLSAMANVTFSFGSEAGQDTEAEWTLDCRGLAARDALTDLRGVKGEMLVLETHEIALSRPVRLLHPRWPIYIVPRGQGRFMLGATMIESERAGHVTARSAMELLNAAYALHPAFAEAEIVEFGSDLRPAFPDNLPRIRKDGRTLYINGLFRHGFLLAPALARMAADIIFDDAHFPEVMDADQRQRQAV